MAEQLGVSVIARKLSIACCHTEDLCLMNRICVRDKCLLSPPLKFGRTSQRIGVLCAETRRDSRISRGTPAYVRV